MRYSVAEIEDQIIATLIADATNFSGVTVQTLTGQINPQMFVNPEYMQGFVRTLPFVLVSYQGRVSPKADRDSSQRYYIDTIRFSLYVGAQSPKKSSEAASRDCYTMLAAVFDDLHGKVPKSTPQQLPSYTALSGKAITTSEFNPQGPLTVAEGTNETLMVNLPGLVVYRTDYQIRLVA